MNATLTNYNTRIDTSFQRTKKWPIRGVKRQRGDDEGEQGMQGTQPEERDQPHMDVDRRQLIGQKYGDKQTKVIR